MSNPIDHTKGVLVLGGTGYLGSELCRLLAEDGMRVCFTYLKNVDRAQALTGSIKNSRTYQLDVTNFDDVHRVVRKAAEDMNGLGSLVHCASSAEEGQLYRQENPSDLQECLMISQERWQGMLDTVLRGAFAAVQSAAKIMAEQGRGNIVLVGSLNCAKAVPAPAHFAAAKGALKPLTESMSKALGEHGILINLVAPGILEGGISSSLHQDIRNEYLKHCSLGRLGTATDISRLIHWLITENTFITGQTLLLDGGL